MSKVNVGKISKYLRAEACGEVKATGGYFGALSLAGKVVGGTKEAGMVKVVINSKIGGYGVYKKGFEYMGLNGECEDLFYGFPSIDGLDPFGDEIRAHPKLVECVEVLGEEAGRGLKVVEIPDDVEWEICRGEDGREWVAEKHRIWC